VNIFAQIFSFSDLGASEVYSKAGKTEVEKNQTVQSKFNTS